MKGLENIGRARTGIVPIGLGTTVQLVALFLSTARACFETAEPHVSLQPA